MLWQGPGSLCRDLEGLGSKREREEVGISRAIPSTHICSPLPAGTCTSLSLSWTAGFGHFPTSQWVQWTPSSQPAPPARGLRNKGLKKSDNFSPQLDLIFFFDAPTAGGRIAGEKQVRQERAGLHRTAAHRLPGSLMHAHSLARVSAWNWGLFCTDRKANDCA